MSWYHRISTFLNYSLPELRATRRSNPGLLTVAILHRRVLTISVLVRARQVQSPYSHRQRKKRLFRFLSNTGFDTVAVQTVRQRRIGTHLSGDPVTRTDPHHDRQV